MQYNKRASELMIGKIRLNELQEIIETLINFDILEVSKVKNKGV
jgi:hypothetical protein